MSRVKSIVKLIVLALVLIVAGMVGYTKISFGEEPSDQYCATYNLQDPRICYDKPLNCMCEIVVPPPK